MVLFSRSHWLRGLLLAGVLSGSGFAWCGQETVATPAKETAATSDVEPPTEAAREVAAFPHERAVADEVLQRQEFQRASSNTWWERKKQRMFGAIQRMFEHADRLTQAAPWLAKTLEWLLFGGAAVGLLVYLLRQMRRQRLHVSLGDGAVKAEAWTRESSDWAQRAEAYAREGAWRDAVHCLYWAAIVLLESRRAWRHNPTRTPREYVRLLKAGSAQQQGLRGLTQIFERTWYGLRETDAREYAEARQLYEGLSSNAAAASSGVPRLDTRELKAEGL
jgi:hypothetical protein